MELERSYGSSLCGQQLECKRWQGLRAHEAESVVGEWYQRSLCVHLRAREKQIRSRSMMETDDRSVDMVAVRPCGAQLARHADGYLAPHIEMLFEVKCAAAKHIAVDQVADLGRQA